MTNQLIDCAAFIAAIAAVTFDRLVLPTLDITYRYVMQELGQQPQLAAVSAMSVAVAPEPVAVKSETKPAPKRRTTRRKTTATKPAAGTGF